MRARKTRNGTKALGYFRVSTTEQANSGLGLAAQEERVRAYAVAAGLELVEVIRDEGVSGSVPIGERAGGRRVLEVVGRGGADHVVALKLDRLFRDAADCLNQTRSWDLAGVALHVVDMGGASLATSSAMGRMFLTLAAAFAELERNLISERTANALAVKRSRRERLGGHLLPYGYRSPDGIHLEPEPHEQEAVALIVRLRARGLSLRAIGEQLTARGYRPRSGASGHWHPQKIANVIAYHSAA